MNPKQSIVKVESNIVVKGNHLLDITKQMLAPYYADLRNWWNSLGIFWKRYFIGFLKDSDDKIDKAGNILYEPRDDEIENIILSSDLFISGNINNLDPLYIFSNIVDLGISYKTVLNDIKGIENLISLESFDCKTIYVSDYESIKKLINLKFLYLGKSKINDLSFLEPLIRLECLELINFQLMNEDILPIHNLKHLRSISLKGTNISNITPLFNLNRLEYVDVRNTKVPEVQIEKFQKLYTKCTILC